MKKSISILSAFLMAVAPVTALPTSAVNSVTANNVTISTSVLNSAINTGDIIVPAGSTAITVSISNNEGFCTSTFKLDINENCNIICDSSNRPVVKAGLVMENSSIVTAQNHDIVVVTSSAITDSNNNGELFTFYSNSIVDPSAVDIEYSELFSIDDLNLDLCFSDSASNNTRGSGQGWFKIGDVNDDDHITSVDATAINVAIALTGQDSIPYPMASAMPTYYFPSISDIDAAFIMNYPGDNVAKADIVSDFSDEIMTYYADVTAHTPYTGDAYIGYVFPIS